MKFRRIFLKGRLILLSLLATVLTASAGVEDSCKWVRIEPERLPDMTIARAGHTVFYADGELTVVGGHTSGFKLTSTAEYFREGEWHLVNTVYLHDNGMAVVLDHGRKALIAGGHEKNLGIGQSYEVEMYDRATYSFNGFGCLDKKRALAQGVELDSGRVLIAGNHQGNDGLELFDGRKFFHHVKDVAAWRSVPYVLRMGDGEVIIFGTVWRNGRFEPCDTVDRLKGDPFCVPLLKEWMPMVYDQNSHATASAIGDDAYLVAAWNDDGEVAFIQVMGAHLENASQDGLPTFSLLPTTCPVPTTSRWGRIKFNRTAIVDSLARRAYLMGNDSTNRAYILTVNYDKIPAPLTIYYTEPLPDFGDTTPVLTPDGDLVVTGGITDDNFAPFSTVWLFRLQTTGEGLQALDDGLQVLDFWHFWLWFLLLAVFAAISVILIRLLRRKASIAPSSPETPEAPENPESPDNPKALENPETPENPEIPETPESLDASLFPAICQLMESQHLYLNPNLKVSDVAEALSLHRNAVSACINAERGCTFNQFVNDYRIAHAKQLLRENPDAKIAAVAIESGFSNERSFFRAFKAATDLTPKEWFAQQQEASE